MVSFALSLQACNTHSGTTNLRAVFLQVWPVAHPQQNHQRCLSLKLPQHLPAEDQKPVFSWPSRALMPPRLEKPGLKGLELPTTPTPQGPLPGTGVHWSSGGLVPASQPWGGDTGPTSSGQAGRQAGWPWVSTGASRLVCVQPSRGRP